MLCPYIFSWQVTWPKHLKESVVPTPEHKANSVSRPHVKSRRFDTPLMQLMHILEKPDATKKIQPRYLASFESTLSPNSKRLLAPYMPGSSQAQLFFADVRGLLLKTFHHVLWELKPGSPGTACRAHATSASGRHNLGNMRGVETEPLPTCQAAGCSEHVPDVPALLKRQRCNE